MFTQIVRTRFGRQAPPRALTLSLVLLIGLMTLMPLMAPGVGAEGQDDENLTTDVASAVIEEETAMTEAEETPETSQPDTPESGDGEALALVINQSGIYLNKWDCPSAFGGDLGQLIANCTVVNNVPFDVFGPNYQASFQGGFSLSAMPAGLYRIREYIPTGYGDPLAFCGFAASNDQQPPLSQVIVYDGYYEFELGQNQSIYCNWFNIKRGAGGSATVAINKHFCPAVAEFDAYSATIYELALNCHEQATPVNFSVTKDGSEIAGGTAQGAPNYLAFENLPTGNVMVIEELPEGYDEPIVYCSVKDELGNARAPIAQVQASYDRISLQLSDGDVVFCDWFNVLEELGTTITVVKYNCPDTIGYGQGGFDEYAEACTEAAAGVSFKLDGARTGNPGEQLTDATGQITWAEMDADHYYLTEEVPSGYGKPVVFCSYYDPAALQVQDREWHPYAVSGENRIEFDVADGRSIVCTFFNIPDRGDGSITIYKWTCPVGYDPFAWGATPWLDCTEATDGVTFTLEQPMDVDLQTDTGDSIPGAVYFGGLTPGVYGVTETLPAGIAYGFVVGCSGLQVPVILPYPLYHTDSGMPFYLELVGGEDIVCSWYNVPEHEEWNGKLTVIKYWCEGTTYSEHECALYGGGAKFALSPAEGGGPPYALETGVDGRASVEISGVGTSAWLLKELNGKPCYVEVSKTEQGAIIVEHGYETVVKVFNCGPDKTTTTTTTTTTTKTGAKQPPVTKFPNTGAGTMSVHGDGESTAITLLLLSVQVALIAAGSLIGFGRTRAVVARVGERR